MTQRHALYALAVTAALAFPSVAQAQDCFADYKAKQDNPLRLHYGVAQVNGACGARAATRALQARLERAGWTLLNVVSVFGPDGLAERKDSAGPYYLRF